MRRILFSALLTIFAFSAIHAHGSGTIHAVEMYSALPFTADENGHATVKNKAIETWLKLITSQLIDNYHGVPMAEFGGRCFYDYLREEFDFHCKHRLLFHWGYNAKPWSADIEKKMMRCPWRNDAEKVEKFKKAFVTEQARRNALANAETEKVFGFASSGKEAAWANGIIAIMYDMHLLGDYVLDDNKDFDGVTPPSKVTGDIINAIRRIDDNAGKTLIKKLSSISASANDEHAMASALIEELQKSFPTFLLTANEGALKQKFIRKGYSLTKGPKVS